MNKVTLPPSAYIVMMHDPNVGTFAPAFQTMDEAEEFSNAVRLATNFNVAEPIPLIKTITVSVREES